MSGRGVERLVLAFSACAIALVPACADGDAGDPAASGGPSGTGGPFLAEIPGQVVAADGQAWMTSYEEGDQRLWRIDLTGRRTDVMPVSGQSVQMASYREGVVVVSVDCADEACDETVTRVVVLDGEGSTLSEQDHAREPGPPEDSDGVWLVGVREDLVWIETSAGLIAQDAQTGQIAERSPRTNHFICLLDDGLYGLSSLSGTPGGEGSGAESFDAPYEVVVERFDDGRWTPLPDTRRTVTMYELSQTDCVGGALRTGQADATSPAWSPDTGWFDAAPYTAPVNRGPEELPYITSVAFSRDDQRFALESDGVIRRVFAAPGAPLSTETVNVPPGVFVHDRNGPPPGLYFDMSSTVVAGCISQTTFDEPVPAQCFIEPA
jgi:hypothetical protein